MLTDWLHSDDTTEALKILHSDAEFWQSVFQKAA